MISKHDLFIGYKRKSQPTTICRSGSNVVLLQFTFGVPLVLLWLSYGILTWIRSPFLDEPRGRSTLGRSRQKTEREEDSKGIRKYTLLTNIGSLVREACLLAPRRYVHETMNICGTMKSNKSSYSLF